MPLLLWIIGVGWVDLMKDRVLRRQESLIIRHVPHPHRVDTWPMLREQGRHVGFYLKAS